MKPGGSVTLKMNRVNIAQRLYRITGQGIYRDSVLLGLKTPIKEPLLNGQIMGSDSVQTIKYRNLLYWFWGDTDRTSYPLGNFRVTGATSKLPGNDGLDPDLGVDLTYFTKDDGFVKSLVPPLPDGARIARVFGLMTTKDYKRNERLLAGYSTHNPDLSVFGILVFNDDKNEFEQLVQFPSKDDWRHPGGPWMTAKKIVTHDNYTFYNPAHDEFFDKDGGRVIYFEGTYTNTFTNAVPMPSYNYNQIMYKLNLDDPKLGLPSAPAPKATNQ